MNNISEESMDASFTEIAKNIKNLRKEHGLTQKQMAERLQMDTHYYSILERGDDPKRKFTLEKVIMVCALFDVTPNDIISKIPKGDADDYNMLELQKNIRTGLKKLSPEKLKGLKDYINFMVSTE